MIDWNTRWQTLLSCYRFRCFLGSNPELSSTDAWKSCHFFASTRCQIIQKLFWQVDMLLSLCLWHKRCMFQRIKPCNAMTVLSKSAAGSSVALFNPFDSIGVSYYWNGFKVQLDHTSDYRRSDKQSIEPISSSNAWSPSVSAPPPTSVAVDIIMPKLITDVCLHVCLSQKKILVSYDCCPCDAYLGQSVTSHCASAVATTFSRLAIGGPSLLNTEVSSSALVPSSASANVLGKTIADLSRAFMYDVLYPNEDSLGQLSNLILDMSVLALVLK